MQQNQWRAPSGIGPDPPYPVILRRSHVWPSIHGDVAQKVRLANFLFCFTYLFYLFSRGHARDNGKELQCSDSRFLFVASMQHRSNTAYLPEGSQIVGRVIKVQRAGFVHMDVGFRRRATRDLHYYFWHAVYPLRHLTEPFSLAPFMQPSNIPGLGAGWRSQRGR